MTVGNPTPRPTPSAILSDFDKEADSGSGTPVLVSLKCVEPSGGNGKVGVGGSSPSAVVVAVVLSKLVVEGKLSDIAGPKGSEVTVAGRAKRVSIHDLILCFVFSHLLHPLAACDTSFREPSLLRLRRGNTYALPSSTWRSDNSRRRA
jgi:hypothetical protein